MIFQTLLSAVDFLVSRFNFTYLVVSSSVALVSPLFVGAGAVQKGG